MGVELEKAEIRIRSGLERQAWVDERAEEAERFIDWKMKQERRFGKEEWYEEWIEQMQKQEIRHEDHMQMIRGMGQGNGHHLMNMMLVGMGAFGIFILLGHLFIW